jgi:tRNA threonylcarbamoyladenosine biosynthesis protein TsaB
MTENWLILETSSRVARVGLTRGDRVLRSVNLDDTRRHARDLAPTVETLLQAESLLPSELTGVMVSQGPGSYTGLRVGITSAKALAYATGCRLIAVDTLAAIANQAPHEASQLWVIADALQNQVYAQPFERSGEIWQATASLQIATLENWLMRLSPGLWVSGPGVTVYEAQIPDMCPRVPAVEREPRIESVFEVGKRLQQLTRTELFALEPLYLRGSSAEEKARSVHVENEQR